MPSRFPCDGELGAERVRSRLSVRLRRGFLAVPFACLRGCLAWLVACLFLLAGFVLALPADWVGTGFLTRSAWVCRPTCARTNGCVGLVRQADLFLTTDYHTAYGLLTSRYLITYFLQY